MFHSSRRESIAAAIRKTHAQLADLDARRDDTAKRLEQLKVELAALAESLPLPCLDIRTSAVPLSIATPATPAEKVALYRRLFRGRDEPYRLCWRVYSERGWILWHDRVGMHLRFESARCGWSSSK